MKTFKKHLAESLRSQKFQEIYDEEKELLQLSFMLQDARLKAGITQKEIARQANLTQQQVSKLENGDNCTILTYLKAGQAVGLKFSLRPARKSSRQVRRGLKKPQKNRKQPAAL
jgi:HTH-type transcriptional regulator/antitoxin HipB